MSTFGRFFCKVWQFCRLLQSFVNYYNVTISARHLLWIYRRLIDRPYIAFARQAQVYRNISAGLQHFIAMHCWMIFNEYHTADKATIYKCTNFQHYLSLLLSAASTHNIKQNPATNPQPTSTLTTWLRKAFSSRRMFWTVWRDNISAIYRDRKKYIFYKYIGNISGLAALARRSLGR